MAREIRKILEEFSEEEREIARFPRSTFIRIRCPQCGYEIITFSHASSKIYCPSCKTLLVEPTGGKAKIYGEKVDEYYY